MKCILAFVFLIVLSVLSAHTKSYAMRATSSQSSSSGHRGKEQKGGPQAEPFVRDSGWEPGHSVQEEEGVKHVLGSEDCYARGDFHREENPERGLFQAPPQRREGDVPLGLRDLSHPSWSRPALTQDKKYCERIPLEWELLFEQDGSHYESEEHEDEEARLLLNARREASGSGPFSWKHVASSEVWPQRAIGYLESTFSNEKTYQGTGCLVGPNHVLTSAQNVFHVQHGWAIAFSFFAGRETDFQPYGRVSGRVFLLPSSSPQKPGTKDRSRPEEQELALVILDYPIGNQVGWFGLLAAHDSLLKGQKIQVAGYSGNQGADYIGKDKSFGCMGRGIFMGFYRFPSGQDLQTTKKALTLVNVFPQRLECEAKLQPGHEGAPAWLDQALRQEAAQPYLVGVCTREGKPGNIIRITSKKFQQIMRWLEWYQWKESFPSDSLLAGGEEGRATFERLNQEAEEGRQESYLELGRCYETGLGTPINRTQAIRWYQEALRNKNGKAYAFLGRLEENQGDFLKAASFYEQGAIQQESESITLLGRMKERGLGFQKNPEEAFKLYLKAARLGSHFAEGLLAGLYERGEGIGQNLPEARRLLELGAHQEDPHAQYGLGVLLIGGIEDGREIKRNNTTEKIDRVHFQKGMEWLEKAAQSHHPLALWFLGILSSEITREEDYHEKDEQRLILVEIPKSIQLSYRAFGLLRDQIQKTGGEPDAWFAFGYLLKELKKEDLECIQWIQKAAEAGHKDAQTHLGHWFENRREGSTEKPMEKARFWYSQAAKQGSARAIRWMSKNPKTGEDD